MRQAIRRDERSTTNTINHIKSAYSDMCTKRKMIPQMEDKLQQLRKRMKMCKGPQQIQEYLRLRTEGESIKKIIREIEEGSEARMFFERARPLIEHAEQEEANANNDQKREALAMALFHSEKAVPVFIQTDRCVYCHHDLLMCDDESILICPKCKRSTKYLQLSTDHVDVDYVAQDTHANHIRSTLTGNVDNMNHLNNKYPKSSLYHKFLMQFSENVPPPPDSVIEAILHELSKVHIMHSYKIQATPIGNILKKKQLKEWAWMSIRISLIIKRKENDPMPIFSEDLIQRLLRRFQKLVEVLKQENFRNGKKVFNFKFLTKVFLLMEGEVNMSELFGNNKTRSVLRRDDKKLGQICKILEKDVTENGFNWKYFRSL